MANSSQIKKKKVKINNQTKTELKGDTCPEPPACPPARTVLLPSEPTLIKEFPNCIQPVGLRLPPSPGSCGSYVPPSASRINQSRSILTNQGFLIIRIACPHLHEDRTIRDQGRRLPSIQFGCPLVQGISASLLHLKTENHVSLAGAETPKTPLRSPDVQPDNVLAPGLPRSQQLCCSTVEL